MGIYLNVNRRSGSNLDNGNLRAWGCLKALCAVIWVENVFKSFEYLSARNPIMTWLLAEQAGPDRLLATFGLSQKATFARRGNGDCTSALAKAKMW